MSSPATRIRLFRGDITSLDCEAIVTAANGSLVAVVASMEPCMLQQGQNWFVHRWCLAPALPARQGSQMASS